MRKPRRSRAVVVGAGITGLAAARVLGDRGMRVSIFEADGEAPRRSARTAFTSWRRRGVPQMSHSHAFLGRLRALLRDHYPDLLEALLAAGARELDMVARPPRALGPLAPAPGDEDLVALGVRRSTFEWVLRREILARPEVRLRPGCRVRGLIAKGNRVQGVRWEHGGKAHELRADPVVDASGRGSQAPQWLRAIGARAVDERQEESGIVYYTRFYRLRPGAEEPPPGPHPALADYNWLKYAVFPTDDRTFSITLAVPLVFPELELLSQVAAFDALVQAIPGLRPWVAAAAPIDRYGRSVHCMRGLVNRRRRFVDEEGALAPGFFVLGDAAYCTNPLYGRGCTQGFLHAVLLGEALDRHPDDMDAAARELDRRARQEIEPFYRASILADREAVRKARGEPAAGWMGRLRTAFFEEGVVPATRSDPVVFRAFARMFNMLETPERAFAHPEVVLRSVATLVHNRIRGDATAPPPIPAREDIVARCRQATRGSPAPRPASRLPRRRSRSSDKPTTVDEVSA